MSEQACAPLCGGSVRWRWDDAYLMMWCDGCAASYPFPIGAKPPDSRAIDVYVGAAGDRFVRMFPTGDHPAVGSPPGEDGPTKVGE